MSGTATTKQLIDASGVQFPVGMIDESGAGTGPYVMRHVLAGGAITERSASVTTGGTSQQLAPANTARKRFLILNPSTAAGQGGIAAAESLYIRFTGAAGVDNGTSFEIVPGGSFDSGAGPCPTDQINVTAATSGHKFVAMEIV